MSEPGESSGGTYARGPSADADVALLLPLLLLCGSGIAECLETGEAIARCAADCKVREELVEGLELASGVTGTALVPAPPTTVPLRGREPLADPAVRTLDPVPDPADNGARSRSR